MAINYKEIGNNEKNSIINTSEFYKNNKDSVKIEGDKITCTDRRNSQRSEFTFRGSSIYQGGTEIVKEYAGSKDASALIAISYSKK